MVQNTTIDTTQLNKNIEEYGFEAAMKWATQYPDTIGKKLNAAFGWKVSEEGYDYWNKVYDNRKSNKPTPTVTPQQEVKEEVVATTFKSSSKVLPFEEEIQRRLDERKATNAKNKAIHEKALELAEASRKKLEKKLKKLIEGVDVE